MNTSNRTSPFLALQHRNFRLLWFGQLISVVGSTMQSAAILWHVSLLAPEAHKGLALGLVGLARVIPVVIFSLVGGVVADTYNRRRLMLATQSFLTLVAAALAVLSFTRLETLWPLYILTAGTAAGAAFDMPARQALVPNLVPREHLPNALTLTSLMFRTAAVVGPSLGGLLIAVAPIGWVYVVNVLSFGAVITGLLLMRGVEAPAGARHAERNRGVAAAVEGLRFVFGEPLIRSTMLLDFFANFFGSAIALLPIFAQDILKVGATGYGWLYAAPSVGALLTSLAMIPLVERIDRRGRVLLTAVGVYGLATIVFGLSRSFWLTFACLCVVGAADTVSTIYRNVIRQLATPDNLRGRMTSVNMLFFFGGPELGELEAGLVANWFGAAFSVISGGIGAVLATLWVARGTPELRAYRREEATMAAGD